MTSVFLANLIAASLVRPLSPKMVYLSGLIVWAIVNASMISSSSTPNSAAVVGAPIVFNIF